VGQSLSIYIEDIVDSASMVSTMESCANGQCVCSTNEYEKVASIMIAPGINSIQLNIEVKPGEVIDPTCISDCLLPKA
jgi:hypothetical protein